MSEMNDLVEELHSNHKPKTKKSRPQNYESVCNSHKDRIGDVVYMPSNPEVKMTVKEVPVCNRAAGHDQYVRVQWLDTNLHIVEATLLAKTLIKDK